VGTNFNYKLSRVVKANTSSGKKKSKYYSLALDFDFEYENDRTYIAFCVPYTFSMLYSFIKDLQFKKRH
jgi:hypothetical protein